MWRAHVPHGERERSDALRAFLVYGVVLLGFAVITVVRVFTVTSCRPTREHATLACVRYRLVWPLSSRRHCELNVFFFLKDFDINRWWLVLLENMSP